MAFVFSYWIIVFVLLLVAVVGLVVAFMMMDKKDRVLINDFIKSASEPQAAEEPKQEVVAEEQKANE